MTISLPGTPRSTVDSGSVGSQAAADWASYLSGAQAGVRLPGCAGDGGPVNAHDLPITGPVSAVDGTDEAWLAVLAALFNRLAGQEEIVVFVAAPGGVGARRIGVSESMSVATVRAGIGTPPAVPVDPAELAGVLDTGERSGHLLGYARERHPQLVPGTALTLSVSDVDARDVRLVFDTSVVDKSAGARFAGHLGTLLESLAERPDEPVGALDILSEQERTRIVAGFNQTRVSHADLRSFAERIADIATAKPDSVAVVEGGRKLTYGELDAAAGRLAAYLARQGVTQGAVVGLLLDRSADAVVATVAALRAGYVLVPLDPADDDERIAFIISDSTPQVVVTDSGLAGRLPFWESDVDGQHRACRVVRVDTDADLIGREEPSHRPVEVRPEGLSHIVYTSGSTGRPKGARVTHRALVNLLNWMPAAYDVTESARGAWASTPGFAIGRMEWMPFLAAGAQVHVADSLTVNSPARIRDWLISRRLTHVLLVSSFARQVCTAHWPAATSLRFVIAVGEPVRWVPRADLPFEVTISYGSTEVAVATSTFDASRDYREELSNQPEGAEPSRRPSVGRPVANARIYVLDGYGRPTPIGVSGEVFVAGDGVCSGYVNPQDVDDPFIANQLAEEPESVLFRTGDIGLWRDDGSLEIVGRRRDGLVRVRGRSLEVGDIEAVLDRLPEVRESAAVAAGDEVIAYVVPARPADPDADSLREALMRRLLDEVVPSTIMLLETLPRLANGKLDRLALPEPPREPGSATGSDTGDRFEPFPLTDTQQAYWVGRGDAVELGNIGCHGYWEWESDNLDVERFERAWRRVVERHDALRTVILNDGTQRVLADPPPYEVPVLDLRSEPADVAEVRARALRDELAHRVFPADQFPLWEVRLTQLPGDRVRIHLGLDLLIIDAWSYFQVLVPDLVAYYENPDAELPPIGLRFRDYQVTVEAARESDVDYQRSKEYWLSRVDDLPPAPDLPRSTGPGPAQTRFTRREHRLDPQHWQCLKDRAAAISVTPSGVVVAAFAEVLRTWSAGDRFTINFPLFNRLPVHPDIDKVIGDFTTTSLLAVDKTDGTFAERARSIQTQLWADLEHRHFSGVRVMRELATRQGVAAHAAFPVVVTSLIGQPPRRFHTALGEAIYTSTQTPQVTLDFQVSEVEGAMQVSWDSVDEAFPPGLLADMFGAYVDLLDRLIADESAWQRDRFSLIPPYQLASRVAANATAAPVPDGLLHTTVAEHAAVRPEATAVVSSGVRLDYANLSRMVNQVGRGLRAAGARPNRLVAVVQEKGWQQVVAAHGVLASGAAYLPIDPGVPPARLRHLLEHGEVELVITQPWLKDRLSWPGGVRVLAVPDDFAGEDGRPLEPVQQPTDLAYVIYTSGSTGKPKGVMVDHRGVLNTIADMNGRLGIGPADRCLAVSALHFDLSVPDLFGIIAAGGTVVIPEPADNPDPVRWAELISREGVTFWNSVPALLEILVAQVEGEPGSAALDTLRAVVLAGDFIPVTLPDRLRALARDVTVIASGGPTETCVWSVVNPLGEVDTGQPSIPYGRPMANQRYHVLDARRQDRPVWVPGEIHIASDVGLAQGYWRDPDRTAAQFFALPGIEERVYASGDLGRYLPDGSIEILGRTDFQVKIQGHRIELGEIEAALAEHPHVERAVAVASGPTPQTRRLIAFVTGNGSKPSETELHDHLAAALPAYLVPAGIRILDELPLTGNGKVDRLALSTMDINGVVGPSDPPAGPVEDAVAAVWCELLGRDSVGRTEHFFALGGNSIIATKVVTRLRELFGVELSLRAVFTEPTVAQIAAALTADPADAEQVLAVCALLQELTDGGEESPAGG